MNSAVWLSRADVAQLLTEDACLTAVENVFRLYATGRAPTPRVLGTNVEGGGFHIKAGTLNLGRSYFVAKLNANFPLNPARHGLPTIQGVVVVFDGCDGRVLALMDSIEITILRTGAATAIAAKYLSRPDSTTATICGCGNQGRISARMLMNVRHLEKFFLYDTDPAAAKRLADDLQLSFAGSIMIAERLPDAVRQSDLIVTCTPSKRFFLKREWVQPGSFIAAVGADHEDKQELDPSLFQSAVGVADLIEQCAVIGELHHAIDAGFVAKENVTELGQIITGSRPVPRLSESIVIFDSTGTALQDVAAAAIVYENAIRNNAGLTFQL